MEMLAIYFAIIDNSIHFPSIIKKDAAAKKGQQQLTLDIKSDSSIKERLILLGL
jgi:hypothetical protein